MKSGLYACAGASATASAAACAKRFEEPITESSTPSASANQVRYVVSLSAPLSRPATSFHRLSAVSSIWRSTPPYHSSPGRGSGEHTNVPEPRQRVETGDE